MPGRVIEQRTPHTPPPKVQRRNLLHHNLADHTGPLVGLAVVAVRAGGLEGGGDSVALGVQVVLV